MRSPMFPSRIRNLRLLLASVFVAGCGPALRVAASSAAFEELGRWPSAPWREPSHLHVRDHLAFVGTGQGLLILDVTDPARPQYLSHLDCVDAGTTDVYAAGDHVYLAAGAQPLRIVNVVDPSLPQLVGELSVNSLYVNALYAEGDHLFLSQGLEGLGRVVVSSPESPVYMRRYVDAAAWGRMQIVGNVGYISTLMGLQIVDLSNPSQRVLKGSVDLGARAEGVAVRGTYAYLPMADGLHVIDVSDADHPFESGVYTTSTGVGAVRLVGDTAYVCVGTSTQSVIQALSLASPTEPSLLGEFPIKGGYRGMEVRLGHVLLVSRFAGVNRMDVVDFSDTGAPVGVAVWEDPGTVRGVSVSAKTVLAACGEAGLKVIDTTDAARPQVVGSYMPPGGGSVGCVGQSGLWTGLGASDAFRLLDLSDPAQPELKGTYVTMMGQVQRMAIDGDRAYLVSGFGMGEFEVLDLADPTAPNRLAGTSVFFDVADLGVASNGTAFLATGSMDLQLFDTTQGDNPAPLPPFGDFPGVYALEVRTEGEDLLVYLAGQDGLAIVEFNDPAQPRWVGQWVQQGANLSSVALSGDRVYVANSQELWAVDVGDPSSPEVVAGHPLGASELAAAGDRVYAVTSAGLVILRLGGSVAEPRLEYQVQGGALLLDWSEAGAGGWVLQHNGDLLDAQGWQTFPGSETTTQWQPELGASRQFFRLAPVSP